jgi:sialic acid synthase SpsE/sugar phosphate isomerase/epimerase
MQRLSKYAKLGPGDFYLVAEVGVNHNGSVNEALWLMQAAVGAGAHAVKFQKRDLAAIYTAGLIEDANTAEWSFQYLLPQLKELELTESDYERLVAAARDLDVDFIVTPFDPNSADFVASLKPDLVKFASADLTNWPLISHALHRMDCPALLSTGMWEDATIRESADFVRTLADDFTLLLCQSTYPAPFASLNLRYLATLKEYAPRIGYSGHERGIEAAVLAYGLGASVIEKHITRDASQAGPDHRASLDPAEFKALVTRLRQAREMLGAQAKVVTQAEVLNREVFAKSLVARRALPKGSPLHETDVDFRSPGKGLFPHQLAAYVGRHLKRAKKLGEYITADDFSEENTMQDWPRFKFSKQWGCKCRFHDFDDYQRLETPVLEFHCSDKDVLSGFDQGSEHSALIVHAPEIIGRELFDLCSDDPAKVEMSRDILRATIDKTRALAPHYRAVAPRIVVHVGGMSISELSCDTLSLSRRAEAILRDLDLDGLELLPENLPPRPWYLGGQWFQYGFMKPEDMAAFCGGLGLGMTFDVCHAQLYCHLAGISLVDYAKIVVPYVRHVHLSDAHGLAGEGVQVDEGEIDWDALMRVLEKIPFSWVPEIWSGHTNYGAGTLTALKRLERYGRQAL